MADTQTFYIGTYTNGGSQGIYRSTLDLETGQCSKPILAAKTENPSFLAIHSEGKHLYAVNEIGKYKGKLSGSVSAFAIEQNGDLRFLNAQPSLGAAPCHLVLDGTGKHVLVANYSGGNVASLPLKKGKLGEASSMVQHTGASVNKSRQEQPHAHSINVSPDNKRAFVADLGLDKVLIYDFDANTGQLGKQAVTAGLLAPGAGPRHVAIHGDHLYVINEIHSTLTLLRYAQDEGTLTRIQTLSTLPGSFHGTSHTADVQLSPDRRFVYGSNRGHDSIAVFKIVDSSGALALVEIEPTQGKSPRNFAIDPSGKFLLAENQGSNTIVVFRIDPQTGALDPLEHQLRVPSPVCVKFLP